MSSHTEQNTEREREDLRQRRFAEAGLGYSLAAVFPVVLSLLLSVILRAFGLVYENVEDYPDWYVYLLYLLSPLALGATVGIFLYRSRTSFRSLFRPAKWQYFPIALALQFGLLFSLSEANALFLRLFELLGYETSETPVPNLEGIRLLPAILVIAVLPALFEEAFFRGVLSRTMHESGWGLPASVLVSGGMFALFHGRPEQTVYQFLCGACLALVSLRAGSILPTVAAHFLNNAAVLLLSSLGYDSIFLLPKPVWIILLVLSGICLSASLVYLVFFDRRNAQKGNMQGGGRFFFAAGIGLLLCGIQWILNLIIGF